MKATEQLRKLLQEESTLVAAGCFDAMSARLAEVVGYKALHITGYGMEATQLGTPDIGLITMTEVITHASHIASAVGIPAICDAEAGWGNVDNLTRAIREFEKAGIAGVHIEDQVTPKRCPVLEGRRLLSREEAVGKIKAAVAARTDPDFVIVARSDGDEVSLDELITRLNLYLEAGADVAMPLITKIDGVRATELPYEARLEAERRICREVKGPLLRIGTAQGTSMKDTEALGYKIHILPLLSLKAATAAMYAVLKEVMEKGTADDYFARHPQPFQGIEFMNLLGLQHYLEIEKQFGVMPA